MKLTNSKNGGGVLLNKAFTLVELLGVIILLGVIALIAYPIVDKTIESSKESALQRTIENIEKTAHTYAVENDLGYPTEKTELYLSELQNKGYLPYNIKNPVTNEQLEGCIWYYWNNNQYVFEYDVNCEKVETEPIIQLVYNISLINSNGWAKEDIAVTIQGNGEVRYCMSDNTCEPNELISTGNNTKFITSEGTTNICGVVSNSLGTSEVLCKEFKLDKTVPTIGSININGTKGNNDWYTSDVNISVNNGSDNLSGHDNTTVNVNSITSNTTGSTVTVTTTDLAGNISTQDYTIKVDKDSPVISAKDGVVEITEGDSNPVSNYFNYSYGISGGSISCSPSNTNSLSVGNQTVSCTVTGENGLSNSASKSITVSPKFSFATDSWETIARNVENGNENVYKVGDEKEVTVSGYGTFTVRIANMSTPDECTTEGFSQTACGFVVEFVDIITVQKMNSTDTNLGGWPSSEMYDFVNTTIYNALPSQLKKVIINTYSVSGHGSSDSNNFTSTDKLYLLSTKEVWGKEETGYYVINDDTAEEETRQLDYYKNNNVTASNYSGAVKTYQESASYWWLRTAFSDSTFNFYFVTDSGVWSGSTGYRTEGVAPAFRIG